MKLNALVAATLGVFCMTGAAQAQPDYPAQPIRLVVGYAPGGPVDTSARTFAKYLGDELNQSVVVENRTGASGMIAAESTSRARPDGYTLNFVASPTLTITPHIQKNASLNLENDFTYLGLIVDYTNVLVINNDIPVNTIGGLIDYARQNPNAVTFGSAGVGASNHLSAELLKQKTGTEMLHVPYRGNAPAMMDVIGGKITYMFDITSTAIPYIESGKVRALAVTSHERNAGLPNVPSMAESGVDDYEVTGWYGLIGPAGLPADVRQKIAAALKSVAHNPAFDENMQRGGYALHALDGQAFLAKAKSEYDMWAAVIEKAGIETQ